MSNISEIVKKLFAQNLVRGRGLFARSLIKAQSASQMFTPVYAAVVAGINTRLPNVGKLVLTRLIIMFKKSFERNDKPVCIASCKFIAHLVNQQVASPVLALEIITLLVVKPTNDSIELACSFIKECGAFLLQFEPTIIEKTFDILRELLHEGNIDQRTQFIIEDLQEVRKTEFADYPDVVEALDIVPDGEQQTSDLALDTPNLNGHSEYGLNDFPLSH